MTISYNTQNGLTKQICVKCHKEFFRLRDNTWDIICYKCREKEKEKENGKDCV